MTIIDGVPTRQLNRNAEASRTRVMIVLAIHFTDGKRHEIRKDEGHVASFEEMIPYLFRKFLRWLRPGWRSLFMSEERKRYYQDDQLYKQVIIDRTQISHVTIERVHVGC